MISGDRAGCLTQDITLDEIVLVASENWPKEWSDRWLGKRGRPRTTLTIPVRVAFETDGDVGVAQTYSLRDISGFGIGLYTHHPVAPGSSTLVDLEINGMRWSGRMGVLHCTETIGCYKVGLGLPGEAPRASQRLIEVVRAKQARSRSQEETNLSRIRDEASKAIRAYHLARMSWGLLGKAVRGRVRRIIKELSSSASVSTSLGVRKHPRSDVRDVRADTCVVLRLHDSWRMFPVWLLDASEDGVGLSMTEDLDNDPIGRELAGEIRMRAGMTLIVRLGHEPGRLWIPGEVMHCSQTDDGQVRVGVQFATPAAQKFFES
ncbi:MAG TPA: PilZ domain-containing protein [Phycisphaerae bacterium]|nr:PilZ domain-containing protein [Phycisphaerae bacterium]